MKNKIVQWIKGSYDNVENRDAWVIKNLQELPRNTRLIDVGAGECKYKKFCQNLQYTAQDFCQYEGTGNSLGLQSADGVWDTGSIDIVSDITDIPVEDNQFDAVLCTEVLEHLPHPEDAIREMGRICKTDGVLLLTAPFCSLAHMTPYFYCTGFSLYWYQTVLEEAGFEIVEAEANGDYFTYMQQELLRLPYVIKRYTNKKGIGTKFLVALLALGLKKYAKKKNESSELLSFGWHIRAKKRAVKSDNL